MASMRSQRSLAILSSLLILVQSTLTQTSNSGTISPYSNQSDVTESAVNQEVSPHIKASATPYSSTRHDTERGEQTEGKNAEKGKMDGHKVLSPGFLLYEVQRDMAALSLDDIEYILNLDEDIFSYSLGDKLGYLKDEEDPHINVIESNKANLLKKIKSQRDKLVDAIEGAYVTQKPALQDNPVTTPSPKHTLMQDNIFMKSKVAYEVFKGINGLSVEAIDSVLDFGANLGSLPYALSQELGYSKGENDPYFQYLVEMDESVLRERLEKAKKAKLEQSLKADRNHAEMMPDSSLLLKQSVSSEKITLKPNQEVRERLTPMEPTENPSNRGTPIHTLDDHDNEDEGKELTPQNEDKVTLTSENPGEIEIANLNKLENLDEDTKAMLIEMLDNKPFLDYLYDDDGDLFYALREGEIDVGTAQELMREYLNWQEATRDEGQDQENKKNNDKENKDKLGGKHEETPVQPSEESERGGEVDVEDGSEAEANNEGASDGEENEDDRQEYLGKL